MLAWQKSDSATVESIKKQEAAWQITLLKSKLDSKKTTRKDFDRMPFMWRAKFIRAGGKVRD